MYQKILSLIRNLSDNNLECFVNSRIDSLESESNISDLSSHIKGYIPSKVSINISNDSNLCYTTKGIDYLDYVNYIRKNVPDDSIGSLIIYTSKYVQDYFGFDLFEVKDNRANYLKKDTLNSISIFKGTKQAKCLELSVLFQNCMSFFDIDVDFFKLYGIKDSGEKIAHAVNIINAETLDGLMHIYFDLSIMEPIELLSGDVIYSPVTKALNEEEYNYLCCGEVIKVKVKKNIEGTIFETILFVKSDFLSSKNKKKF